MSLREIYQQKIEAQLDEWTADNELPRRKRTGYPLDDNSRYFAESGGVYPPKDLNRKDKQEMPPIYTQGPISVVTKLPYSGS